MGFLEDIGKTIGDFIGGLIGGGSPPPSGGGLNPPLIGPTIPPGQITYQPIKSGSGASGSNSYNRSSSSYNRKKYFNKAYSAMQKSRRQVFRPKLQKISRPTRSPKQISQKPSHDLIQNAISIITNYNPLAHLSQLIGGTTKSVANLIKDIIPKDISKRTPSVLNRIQINNRLPPKSKILAQQKAMGGFRKIDFGKVGTGSAERYHTSVVGLSPQSGVLNKTITKRGGKEDSVGNIFSSFVPNLHQMSAALHPIMVDVQATLSHLSPFQPVQAHTPREDTITRPVTERKDGGATIWPSPAESTLPNYGRPQDSALTTPSQTIDPHFVNPQKEGIFSGNTPGDFVSWLSHLGDFSSTPTKTQNMGGHVETLIENEMRKAIKTYQKDERSLLDTGTKNIQKGHDELGWYKPLLFIKDWGESLANEYQTHATKALDFADQHGVFDLIPGGPSTALGPTGPVIMAGMHNVLPEVYHKLSPDTDSKKAFVEGLTIGAPVATIKYFTILPPALAYTSEIAYKDPGSAFGVLATGGALALSNMKEFAQEHPYKFAGEICGGILLGSQIGKITGPLKSRTAISLYRTPARLDPFFERGLHLHTGYTKLKTAISTRTNPLKYHPTLKGSAKFELDPSAFKREFSFYHGGSKEFALSDIPIIINPKGIKQSIKAGLNVKAGKLGRNIKSFEKSSVESALFFGGPDTAYLPFIKGGLIKIKKVVSDVPYGLRKLAKTRDLIDTQGIKQPYGLGKELDLAAYDYYFSGHRGEMLASPKPITGYKWKGMQELEYVMKPGTKIYPTTNIRTQFYRRFGIKKGTSYNIDPTTGGTIEIMEFVTKRPPSTPTPKMIINLPKLKQKFVDFTTRMESGQLHPPKSQLNTPAPPPKKSVLSYTDTEGEFAILKGRPRAHRLKYKELYDPPELVHYLKYSAMEKPHDSFIQIKYPIKDSSRRDITKPIPREISGVTRRDIGDITRDTPKEFFRDDQTDRDTDTDRTDRDTLERREDILRRDTDEKIKREILIIPKKGKELYKLKGKEKKKKEKRKKQKRGAYDWRVKYPVPTIENIFGTHQGIEFPKQTPLKGSKPTKSSEYDPFEMPEI